MQREDTAPSRQPPQGSATAVPPPSSVDDLERFRQEWRKDISQRRQERPGPPTGLGERKGPESEKGNGSAIHHGTTTRSHLDQDSTASNLKQHQGDFTNLDDAAVAELTIQMQKCFSRNVRDYADAVIKEKAGELDQALELYRATFRSDPDVDRTFQTALLLSDDPQATSILHHHPELLEAASHIVAAAAGGAVDFAKAKPPKQRVRSPVRIARLKEPDQDVTGVSQGLKSSDAKAGAEPHVSNLEALVEEGRALRRRVSSDAQYSKEDSEKPPWLHDINEFSQADEEQSCALARVPDEILLHVLHHLATLLPERTALEAKGGPDDNPVRKAAGKRNAQPPNDPRRKALPPSKGAADHGSLETLARSCWKWRLLTLEPSLWQRMAEHVYREPQLLPPIDLQALCTRHDSQWRSMFISQPRVRTNGVYIASCRYSRTGVDQDNVWVKVIHVVEFYRYFRFLPDGRCLSLQCTDAPAETVRKIDPSLRVKGFAIGTWQLHPEGLPDDSECGRPPGPKVEVTSLHDESMPHIRFRVILFLRNGGAFGRWNKMEWLEYRSVNLRNGEDEPLPQKHSRPFFFSAVRSYTT